MTPDRVHPRLPAGLPATFTYGVTTAATCIESRQPEIGRLSIWDVFAAAPGRVTDGTVPLAGPAHLTHRDRDLALLSELGVDAYRFSLPWSALAGDTPDGDAIGFYDQLLDGLTAAGIAPIVTLTHYEMPLAVMEDGGWLVRDTGERFAAYADAMATRFADRVAGWVTMNSPFVHAALGYGLGIEAPGLTLLGGALHVAQNQLIGHGLAVQALRAAGAATVGIANAHTRVTPATDSDADVRAAQRYDALHNHALADPLFGRPWPEDLTDFPGGPAEQLSTADASLVAAPLDFYGVNYFHPQVVQDDPHNATIPFALSEPAPDARTDPFGWPVDPSALTDTLTELARRHPDLPPVWVTENGTQDAGGTADGDRVRHLTEHLTAVADAVRAGVDVRGYFHWSLLDGWEFAEGLGRRFGLVAVDPDTGERTPKDSYRAYRELLAGRER